MSRRTPPTWPSTASAFEGTILSWIDDRADYGEIREISIGLIRNVVAVTVVHTKRRGKNRIISARLANRNERRLYHEHIG
jgi:uncharacterized DUF497 family protein